VVFKHDHRAIGRCEFFDRLHVNCRRENSDFLDGTATSTQLRPLCRRQVNLSPKRGTTFVLAILLRARLMTSITTDGHIEFRFYRPGATAVSVSGDFNGWSNNALTMEELGDGWWQAVAPLKKGEYRFRYFVDGEWFTDYAANGVEQTRFGWNSVLVVSQSRDRMQQDNRAAA
jgi:hypothetical protein